MKMPGQGAHRCPGPSCFAAAAPEQEEGRREDRASHFILSLALERWPLSGKRPGPCHCGHRSHFPVSPGSAVGPAQAGMSVIPSLDLWAQYGAHALSNCSEFKAWHTVSA